MHDFVVAGTDYVSYEPRLEKGVYWNKVHPILIIKTKKTKTNVISLDNEKASFYTQELALFMLEVGAWLTITRPVFEDCWHFKHGQEHVKIAVETQGMFTVKQQSWWTKEDNKVLLFWSKVCVEGKGKKGKEPVNTWPNVYIAAICEGFLTEDDVTEATQWQGLGCLCSPLPPNLFKK